MTSPAPRSQIAIALASVYVIWGSTYLAIRFALETLPPFSMAGARFVVAGAILYTIARVRGAAAPRPIEWRSAAIIGALLLVGGNGGVVWAEKTVPSGIAALLVATMPLFMAGLAGAVERTVPSARTIAGLVAGSIGVVLLVGPGAGGGPAPQAAGVVALLAASASWAVGSIYSRRAPLPDSSILATGMEMLAGGALLLVVGTARGEWSTIALAAVSTKSWLAVAYLLVFGSLVGFTAYIWLLKHTTPTVATTYAYVNPLVAVLLGWALAGEALGGRIAIATVFIVGSVVLTTTAAARGGPSRPRTAEAAPAPRRAA